MPIYEYRCKRCHKVVTQFLRDFSQPPSPTCTHCGSGELTKLVSRVAILRSEERRLEDLADSSDFADLDESDPRSMARWARRLEREMGEELGPEFHDLVDRMEAGDVPEEGLGDAGEGLEEG